MKRSVKTSSLILISALLFASGEVAARHAMVMKDPKTDRAGLNHQNQGYWVFTFAEPVTLEAGTYWIVLQKAPGKDPGKRARYLAHLNPGLYPGHHVMKWTPAKGWHATVRKPAFFGVHGRYDAD